MKIMKIYFLTFLTAFNAFDGKDNSEQKQHYGVHKALAFAALKFNLEHGKMIKAVDLFLLMIGTKHLPESFYTRIYTEEVPDYL